LPKARSTSGLLDPFRKSGARVSEVMERRPHNKISGLGELLNILMRIEFSRANLASAKFDLDRFTAADPARLSDWQAFIAAGGVTSMDLKLWIKGEALDRPARIESKGLKHLRLVAEGSLPAKVVNKPLVKTSTTERN
jgi:hypothetical protein